MIFYADISTLIELPFLTGIQRVTVELLSRLHKITDWDIKLLHYDPEKGSYRTVERLSFERRYVRKETAVKPVYLEEIIMLEQFSSGSIFLDIDSAWMSKVRRSFLLPILKGNGVKIVAHIYDVIPIKFPQYCYQWTIFNFMDYIAAHLTYADFFLANAQATIDDLQELAVKLDTPAIRGAVVPLGADFSIMREFKLSEVDKTIVEIARKEKYILMVGTIEPRKNHKLLLDAFEYYLTDTPINIVFAGRIGWDMDDFEERLRKHPLKNKRIFQLENVNDMGIDFLYKNTFLVAFLSYSEGFGLPIIEAFQKGAPVIASDMKVSREIAGDYCDYVKQDDAAALADMIKKYLENPEIRAERVHRIKDYPVVTWDDSAEIFKKKLILGVINEISKGNQLQ
jgi:glycosyltransferase involved in cell wall biosynthesis